MAMDDRTERAPETDSDEVLLELPDAHREAFKDPLGPIHTDEATLCDRLGAPIITIGDIVTASFLQVDCIPDVSVVDGMTKRRPIGDDTESTLAGLNHPIKAVNPAGTITRSLVSAIVTALSQEPPVKVVVDGEEDLAVLPAVLAAPDGASVIYGQPDEGMVVVTVDAEHRRLVGDLLEYLEGDMAAFRSLIER